MTGRHDYALRTGLSWSCRCSINLREARTQAVRGSSCPVEQRPLISPDSGVPRLRAQNTISRAYDTLHPGEPVITPGVPLRTVSRGSAHIGRKHMNVVQAFAPCLSGPYATGTGFQRGDTLPSGRCEEIGNYHRLVSKNVDAGADQGNSE